MKRVLALALLLALLAGCGVSEVDITNTPPPLEIAPPESGPPASAPVETAPVETAAPPETAPPAPEAAGEPGDMVRIVDIIPNIYIDLRYAAADNFTGRAIYPDAEAYLRRSTAEKLARVQERLNGEGLSLCVWDGWRSVAAQFALWRACPDPAYVADPIGGVSGHCRGNTVDITLVTLDGGPVEMPTGFDDFSARADRDYSDVSAEAAANARLLEDAMAAEGFSGYWAEWWHYTDSDAYDVRESLEEPEVVYITQDTLLYASPDAGTPALGLVQAGEGVRVLDEVDGFLLVSRDSGRGYIPAQPPGGEK